MRRRILDVINTYTRIGITMFAGVLWALRTRAERPDRGKWVETPMDMRRTSTSTLERAVVAIAVSTVLSGLLQMARPGSALRIIGAERTATSRHVFGIVGMFMTLFGGATLHAVLINRRGRQSVLIWAALQKYGASLAVAIGVRKGIFSRLALLVAAFDLMSGLMMGVYRRRVAPDDALERVP